MSICIISDLHGNYQKHLEIVQNNQYTLSLGDVGFNYDYLKDINSDYHKIIFGNHENFDDMNNWPHFLPRFGFTKHNDIEFFHVGGAFSIDKQYRLKKYFANEWPKTWWDEEELSAQELERAIDLYTQIRPDIVLTHDCPSSISKLIGSDQILYSWGFNPDVFKTNTGVALNIMFGEHKPKLWFFGHYHKDWCVNVDGTEFRCLKEFGTYII